MRRVQIARLVALVVVFGVVAPSTAAEFQVEVGGPHGLSFSPANLTIEVGDTVTWTNRGGVHNVVADNGEFRNGNASGASWSFSFTFQQAGTFPYHCEPHRAQGMTGTIVVQADDNGGGDDGGGDDGGQGEAGVVRFESGETRVDESADAATVTVQRSGGTDGAVSVRYATSAGSAEAGVDYQDVSGRLDWAEGDGTSRSFQVPILDDGEQESPETVELRLSNPDGGVSLGQLRTATLTIEDDDLDTGPCIEDEETLCLQANDRFEVRLDFRTPDASGRAKTLDFGARDSGLFYFFNPNNAEMLVKVLNGCPVTGLEGYWVFYAATTNVEFTLTVRDTESGEVRRYPNALGETASPIQDTTAFKTCP